MPDEQQEREQLPWIPVSTPPEVTTAALLAIEGNSAPIYGVFYGRRLEWCFPLPMNAVEYIPIGGVTHYLPLKDIPLPVTP